MMFSLSHFLFKKMHVGIFLFYFICLFFFFFFFRLDTFLDSKANCTDGANIKKI